MHKPSWIELGIQPSLPIYFRFSNIHICFHFVSTSRKDDGRGSSVGPSVCNTMVARDVLLSSDTVHKFWAKPSPHLLVLSRCHLTAQHICWFSSCVCWIAQLHLLLRDIALLLSNQVTIPIFCALWQLLGPVDIDFLLWCPTPPEPVSIVESLAWMAFILGILPLTMSHSMGDVSCVLYLPPFHLRWVCPRERLPADSTTLCLEQLILLHCSLLPPEPSSTTYHSPKGD